MTKKELLDEVLKAMPTESSQISRLKVETVFEAFCNVVAAELLGGGEIPLMKIGKLKVKDTASRMGRNPWTGEAIEIPAGKKVVFAPYRDFREALHGEGNV